MMGRDAIAAHMRAQLLAVRHRIEELKAIEKPNTGDLGELADALYAEQRLSTDLQNPTAS